MKIMIVDDEAIVRIAFKSLIDWKALGCEIIEASNGQNALKKFKAHNADVVVTDIKMPVMDGLELISHILALAPETVIFMLSAFDDFPFVKQAFLLGSKDYILKADMNEESLMRLYRSAEKLIKGGGGAPGPRSEDQTAIFFTRCIAASPANAAEAEKMARALRIPIRGHELWGALLSVRRFDEVLRRYGEGNQSLFSLSIVNCVQETLSGSMRGRLFPVTLQKHFLLLSFPLSDAPRPDEQRLLEFCRRIQKQTEDTLNISISVGVSGPVPGDISKLCELYEKAACAAEYIFFMPDNQPLFRSGVSKLKRQIAAENVYTFKPDVMFRAFQTLLGARQGSLTPVKLESVLYPPQRPDPSLREDIIRLYTRYYYSLLAQVQMRSNMADLMTAVEKFGKDLAAGEYLVSLNSALSEILTLFSEWGSVRGNYLVEQAKDYIRNHYSSPINLGRVAFELNVSEEHLSRLFSETTGESFSRFLTGVRIEQAKKLLASGKYKVFEVAELVGYSSTEHFTRVFKETEGVNPKKYMARPDWRG